MAEDAELQERQEDELEALKAIFVGEVEDEEVRSKNKEDALSYTVRLLPESGSSVGDDGDAKQKVPTFIVLGVEIPKDYPKSIPIISFKEHKGLNLQELSELEDELKAMANQSVGEVMMFELCSYARNYLYNHQKRSTGSFYDEMVMRQKQQEERKLQKQMDLKEKERLAIREEILRKQKEEKEEIRKLKERRSQPVAPHPQIADDSSPLSSPQNSPIKGDSFPLPSYKGRNNSTIGMSKRERRLSAKRRLRTNSEGSDSSPSDSSTELSLLEFTSGKTCNMFYRGNVIGKSPRGTTVSYGMSRTGSPIAISEWKFTAVLDKKGKEKSVVSGNGDTLTLESVMKQLYNFEVEMNVLQKLEHPNIVMYFGLKSFSPVDEPGTILVYLAEEFVGSLKLQSFIGGSLAVDLALVRHCAKGVLEALNYLHNNDIVHRFLRDSSIFLDSSGDVRITDYGIERKIYELHQQYHQLPAVEDKFPPSLGRGGKKGDIYRFGVIILSLVNGRYATNPPIIPTHLPPDLQDFLQKCMTPAEHSRWSASELLGHQFLKTPIAGDPVLKFLCTEAKMEENLKCVKPKKEEDESEEEMEDLPQLPQPFKGPSRVNSEFEVLKFLGKGGFGDVLKVKNKLDGRMYALKRIKLNPKNKQLNKKITREVKLLSQLNHENVVRYFNSWIETVIESDDEASNEDSLSLGLDTTDSKLGPLNANVNHPRNLSHSVRFQMKPVNQNSLGLLDNAEELAPSYNADDTSWGAASTSTGAGVQNAYSDESEESSDDDDLFGTSFRRITMEESEEIIFESSGADHDYDTVDHNALSTLPSTETDTNEKVSSAAEGVSISLSAFLRESQYLYIQMEFCEKSTLRTAIDGNLCEDLDRAWRLFREIVEGLVHIHQQGMIHRDLKPVNIFLDYNDHVKIGDFGLATSSILKRPDEMSEDVESVSQQAQNQSLDFTDEPRTGQVGTALYVAPELITTGQKVTYNQKVDIYSLGVMFFEMFYHPPGTAMERVLVIKALRQKSISFPSDFDHNLLPQVTHITKWLLDHDHTKRPTSLELLQSDYLPPPHLEEAGLRDIFSRTLRSSKTKSYKYLIKACLSQEADPVEDATYDSNMDIQIHQRNTKLLGNPTRSLYFVQRVKQVIYQVFERHGAVEVETPHLMPKSSSLYGEVDTCVNLMCHGGGVVSIPHDLRIPFARYVGRNGVTSLKRFTIDKVFRERKIYGLHPRELIECAFDIIEPSQGSLIADSEVISVVFEILRELPWMKNKTCSIRLGHTKLLQGFMLHHAVDEKHFKRITKLLSDVRNERDSKQQIQTHLCSLGLSDHFVTTLLQVMDVEGSFSKISSMLKGIMKRKGEAASCIKEGLHELEVLINNIESYGIKCNITVVPAMTFCSHIYSGLLFQVACELKRKKNKVMVDVIAAGGRYDSLIQDYWTSMNLEQDGSGSQNETPSGVGISLSLDKLISGFDQSEDDDSDSNTNASKGWAQKGSVDVVVCSLGHRAMAREKIEITKEFSAQGVRVTVLNESPTLESAEEFCKEIGAVCLVILKEGEYFSNVRVRVFERGRFDEKKLSKSEALDFVPRLIHDIGSSDGQATAPFLRTDTTVSGKGPSGPTSETCCLVGTASGSHSHAHHSHHHSGNPLPPYNVSILIQEREKLVHIKRKYENQVMSRITDILAKFGRQQNVEVLGLEVNSTVIRDLACLSLNDREEYCKGVSEVIEKQPRLKKYLKNVCDEMLDLIYDKNATVLILFGLVDNSYKILA